MGSKQVGNRFEPIKVQSITQSRTHFISDINCRNAHFWLKNDGEKWSRKNYFEIPRWPSEIPSNLPG